MHAPKMEVPPKKIMVVDDSHAMRISVKRILMSGGFDVVCASDGHEAIAELETNPDLMVLDINMPGLDGYGVCEELEAANLTRDKLPVVFITSNDSRAMELLGERYGAYLRKPVKPDELLRVVNEQLSAKPTSVISS